MKLGKGLRLKFYIIVLVVVVCLSGCQKSHVESTEKTTDESKRTVDIHMDIDVSDVDMDVFPVIKVKPHKITAEEGRRFVELLFENACFYETSIDPIMSRTVVQEKIQEWERLNNTEVIRDIYGDSRLTQVKTVLQQTVENLKSLDQFEEGNSIRETCKWEFHPEAYYAPKVQGAIDDNGNNTIMAYIEKGSICYKLWLTNRDESDYRVQNIFVYPNSEYASPWDIETLYMIRTMCGYQKPSAEDVDCVMEKAGAIVNSVGIGEWAIVDYSVGTYKYWQNTEKPVYVVNVTAVPSYDGINVLHVNQLETLKSNDEHAANYYYSELLLTFSPKGELIEATLTSPIDTISVVESDVKVIDMQESIDSLTSYLENWETSILRNVELGGIEECSIRAEIDNVEFGLARVNIEDDPNSFYLIPAVQFSGNYSIMHNDKTIYSHRNQYGTDYEFATISLLDGSVVNAMLRY